MGMVLCPSGGEFWAAEWCVGDKEELHCCFLSVELSAGSMPLNNYKTEVLPLCHTKLLANIPLSLAHSGPQNKRDWAGYKSNQINENK